MAHETFTLFHVSPEDWWASWLLTVISTCMRLRQGDCHQNKDKGCASEYRASQGYTVRPCLKQQQNPELRPRVTSACFLAHTGQINRSVSEQVGEPQPCWGSSGQPSRREYFISNGGFGIFRRPQSLPQRRHCLPHV